MSDFVNGQSFSEKMCCIKPDQFGLGLSASLNIQPECQRISGYNCNSKVWYICRSITGLNVSDASPLLMEPFY